MRAVNLIPGDQRSGASVGAGRSGGAAYAVVGLLAGLALMGVLYGIAHHQIANRQNEVASLHEKTQRAQQEAQALASYTSFVQMRQQRVSAVEALVDSRFDWAHVMHEFGRVLPSGVSITLLSGTVGATGPGGGAAKSATAASSSSGGSSSSAAGSSVTSATPPGAVPTFQLSGCTGTQSKVAETLTRLRLIDGVTTVSLVSSTKGTSGGGSGGGGASCPETATDFSATVTFQALPAISAAVVAPHASTVANGVSGK